MQGNALFKLAASRTLLEKETNPGSIIELSVKYQIPCELTAIVGQLKVQDKATGELKEAEPIRFVRGHEQVHKPPPKQVHVYHGHPQPEPFGLAH